MVLDAKINVNDFSVRFLVLGFRHGISLEKNVPVLNIMYALGNPEETQNRKNLNVSIYGDFDARNKLTAFQQRTPSLQNFPFGLIFAKKEWIL